MRRLLFFAALLGLLAVAVRVTQVQTPSPAHFHHVHLNSTDPQKTFEFYEQVFGLREYGRGDGLVHTQASGRHDIVTFVEDPTTAGLNGGIAHFGFRLVDPDDIDRAIAEVERAGGRLLRRGEFAPGLPYAYVADPDGYEIEIWFE